MKTCVWDGEARLVITSRQGDVRDNELKMVRGIAWDLIEKIGPGQRRLWGESNMFMDDLIHELFPRQEDPSELWMDSRDWQVGDPGNKLRVLIGRVIERLPAKISHFHELPIPAGTDTSLGVLHVDTNLFFRLIRAYDVVNNAFKVAIGVKARGDA